MMKSPLLIIAGAKGAVGTTVAAAVADMKQTGENTFPWLITANWADSTILQETAFAGWDLSDKTMPQSLALQGVLSEENYRTSLAMLDTLEVRRPPAEKMDYSEQIRILSQDIRDFVKAHPHHQPVLINLLPACAVIHLEKYHALPDLYRKVSPADFPDLAYVMAAIACGVPVVNFTSNAVECPLVVQEAFKAGVPLCGRDGKTGQTYLKVVIASALKARNLLVDGWYSLNILGNEDGRNLSDPQKASGKLANKTDFLDTILGYPVGQRYGQSTHKVAIEYYPPRGDRKEAWDVIDFTGLFGLPMSIRMNMQLRDSVLAAPMVIDLAVWMAALKTAGRSGFVSELAFYFKKAPLPDSPVAFQEQVAALQKLAKHLK
mgnify:CR=1 FL=1